MDDGIADGHLDVRILGPLEVRRGEVLLPLGGHRQQAVLACLVVSKGFATTTDRIADAIWGESPPPGYLTTLQTYVYHLREVLEPGRARGERAQVLATSAGGYRLVVPEEGVDAKRFEKLVLQGQRLVVANPERASALLGEALALWRDDPLPDFTDLEPVSREASRLDELRQSALESWAEAELVLGHHTALTPELGRLVAAYPLREGLHAQRMLALYRDGRQAEALAAFRQLRLSLDEELGIEPSSRLRQLHEQILRHDPSLDWRGGDHPAPESKADLTEPAAIGERHRFLVRNASRTNGSPRRRWTAVVGIVAMALALLGYTVVRVVKADDVTPVPPNTVAMLSANGLDGDAVPVPGTDISLAAGAGSVWAVDETGNALRRIDPRTRQVIQTIPGVGGSPQSVAVSGNDVWVAGFDEGVVKRVNAVTDTVTTIAVGNQPSAVLAKAGQVWVANSGDNTVQRIDPSTNDPGPPHQVGTGPDGLALDGTTLWVANSREASVTRLDTTSGERAADDIVVGDGPRGLALTDSDVWVADELGQKVTRIDRASGQTTTIAVEDGPSSVVVIDGFAWVNNAYSDSISRIDTRNNAVSRIALGSSPQSLVDVDGKPWVATGSFGDIRHKGGTLVYTMEAKYLGPTLDPALAYNPPPISLLRSIYDGLVSFRATGRLAPRVLVPDLATSLPRPADGGRTYVFTIRPGIHYSTGAEVKATDFVMGLRRAVMGRANPAFFQAVVGAQACLAGPTALPENCQLLEGVSADDATRRVTIRLSEPDPDFLYKLAYFVVPTPSGIPLTDVGRHATIPGTGPYMMSAVGTDSAFTLTRNPYFRQWSFAAQPYGYPDEIRFQPAPSAETAVEAVVAGRADIANLGLQQRATLTGHDDLIKPYDAYATDWAYLNPTVSPFDDPRVRQALNFAVDRRTLASLLGGGPGSVEPSCQLLPPSFPAYERYCPYQIGDKAGPYLGPDLSQAQRLVQESGRSQVPITVHAFHKVHDFDAFPEYLADRLRAIGFIHVNVEDIPEAVADGDPVYGEYQMFTQLGWWADYPDPQSFYDTLFSCTPPSLSHYCNPAIEAVAAEAKATTQSDPAHSLALWKKVDQMLTADAAFVTLGNRHPAQLVSARVGNVQLAPGFGAILSQLWVQ